MNKKEKIIYSGVSVLLALSVVLCITVVVQTMSKGYVTIMGTSLFRVVTGSMEPTIPTGALLISREIDIEDVKEDDIICFRSRESAMLGQVITHRVSQIIENESGQIYLETCGDANPSVDGYYVTESNLIGKVSYYTKEGNILARIFSVVTSKVGFLSCIVFPVLLISGFVMRDSVKSIRRELKSMAQEDQKEKKEPSISAEEYDAMVKRLKSEILEEVRQSVEKAGTDEQTRTEQ